MAKPGLKTTKGLSLNQGGLSELKHRLLFVLIAILIYRIGAHIPVPGLDPGLEYVRQFDK